MRNFNPTETEVADQFIDWLVGQPETTKAPILNVLIGYQVGNSTQALSLIPYIYGTRIENGIDPVTAVAIDWATVTELVIKGQ